MLTVDGVIETEIAADAVTVEALEEAAVTPAQPELPTTKASIKTNSTRENPRERCIQPHSVALLNAMPGRGIVEGVGGLGSKDDQITFSIGPSGPGNLDESNR